MIALRDVSFAYHPRRTALVVPTLDITAGLTLVVGPNGAGKSTMLRLIAGVDAPAQGRITIYDADLWRDEVEARRALAFVPENPELTPYATVFDTLRLVAALRGAPEATIVDALDRVGLLALGARTIRELSMGQRRRAMLATALIGTPRVVILDEPLETLDVEMRAFVRDWVFGLRAEGKIVLVATHDVASFAPSTDAVVVVRERRAVCHDLSFHTPSEDRLEIIHRTAGGSPVAAREGGPSVATRVPRPAP